VSIKVSRYVVGRRDKELELQKVVCVVCPGCRNKVDRYISRSVVL